MDELDPQITENEDGSAEVDLPEIETEEQPDGSAIVTMEEDGPEINPDFYANMSEDYDDFKLMTLASRYVDLLKKDKDARENKETSSMKRASEEQEWEMTPPAVQRSWAPRKSSTLPWQKVVLTLPLVRSKKCSRPMAPSEPKS